MYISYIAGTTLQDGRPSLGRHFALAGLFVLGFLVVFVILGFGATSVGKLIQTERMLILRFSGALLIVFGLLLTDWIRLPFLYRSAQWRPQNLFRGSRPVQSFLLGVSFAAAWTPCIGPVLGTIFLLASQAETSLQGGVLLGVFGLGIAVPFLIISLFTHQLTSFIHRAQKVSHVLQKISGMLLVALGLLLVTNQYAILAGWVIRWLRFTPML